MRKNMKGVGVYIWYIYYWEQREGQIWSGLSCDHYHRMHKKFLSICLFHPCVNGKQYICVATAFSCAQIWAMLKPIMMGRGEIEAWDAAHVEWPNGGRLKATRFKLATCPCRACLSCSTS